MLTRPMMLGKILFAGFLSLGFYGKAQDTIPSEILNPAEIFYTKMYLATDPLLLDVRPYKAFVKSRIPGAISADSIKCLLSIADSTDKEQPVFIYCEDSDRSSEAAGILLEEGFLNVCVLKGGFSAWVKRKYPLDKKRIHRKQWR